MTGPDTSLDTQPAAEEAVVDPTTAANPDALPAADGSALPPDAGQQEQGGEQGQEASQEQTQSPPLTQEQLVAKITSFEGNSDEGYVKGLKTLSVEELHNILSLTEKNHTEALQTQQRANLINTLTALNVVDASDPASAQQILELGQLPIEGLQAIVLAATINSHPELAQALHEGDKDTIVRLLAEMEDDEEGDESVQSKLSKFVSEAATASNEVLAWIVKHHGEGVRDFTNLDIGELFRIFGSLDVRGHGGGGYGGRSGGAESERGADQVGHDFFFTQLRANPEESLRQLLALYSEAGGLRSKDFVLEEEFLREAKDALTSSSREVPLKMLQKFLFHTTESGKKEGLANWIFEQQNADEQKERWPYLEKMLAERLFRKKTLSPEIQKTMKKWYDGSEEVSRHLPS